LATQILRRTRALTEAQGEELLKDTDADVRVEALDFLVEMGREVSPEEVYAVAGALGVADRVHDRMLRRSTREQLLDQIRWNSNRGYAAYRLLATEHFSSIAGRIRADLDSDFESLLAERQRFVRRAFGSGQSLRDILVRKQADDFIRGLYIGAALAGLT